MPVKNKSKKTISPIGSANIYITATFNNTLITITDLKGNTISWASAGLMGFKGTKKSTPFAASSATKKALSDLESYQIKEVNIFVSGVGSGRDAALRAITSFGLEINSIKDSTPLAHNGVRAKKARRV